MIKAIFFDLDHTLLDLKKSQDIACEHFYKYFNFSTKTDLITFLNKWEELVEYHYEFYTRKEISYEEQRIRRIVDLFKYFDIELNIDPLKAYDVYLEYFENNWSLYEDTENIIKYLYNKKYILGVITNGDLKQQLNKLEKTNILKYMTDVVAASEYEYSKPDKRIFESAINKNNLNYNEFCFVGDDLEDDIYPCLELNIKSIWINRKNKLTNNKNIIEIHSLKELEKMF